MMNTCKQHWFINSKWCLKKRKNHQTRWVCKFKSNHHLYPMKATQTSKVIWIASEMINSSKESSLQQRNIRKNKQGNQRQNQTLKKHIVVLQDTKNLKNTLTSMVPSQKLKVGSKMTKSQFGSGMSMELMLSLIRMAFKSFWTVKTLIFSVWMR